MIYLAFVDNTSDINKPVSTATQNALDLKAPGASPTFTGTVTIMNGMTIGAGSIKIYKPIEMGYSEYTPMPPTCIGGMLAGTYNTTLPTNGATVSVVSMSVGIGVWSFCANVNYTASNISLVKMVINNYNINSFLLPIVSKTQKTADVNWCDNINTIYVISSPTNIYLTVKINFTGTLTCVTQETFLRCTRLA